MNRTTLNEKISHALEERQLGALIAYGPDHFQYLTGVSLPFLSTSYTRQPVVTVWIGKEPACIAPAWIASSLSAQGWHGPIRTYAAQEDPTEVIARIIADLLVQLPAGKPLAVDYERITTHQLDALQRVLKGRKLTEGDTLLRQLRMVKTAEEIEILERLAEMTDHGIAGAMHHVSVLGERTEKFMSEDLRVHCLERGTELYGYHAMSLTASGIHANQFWPISPRFGLGREKKMQPGEAVRMEMRAVLEGYWCDAARTLTMGPATPAQADGYAYLMILTQTALNAVRPGRKACDVYTAVVEKAKELSKASGVHWIGELGVGHGVGVTPYEEPFLSGWDPSPLEAGMVLAIDITVRLPSGEILRGKETVTVIETGHRMAETYQDWRMPYTAAFTF